MAKKKENTPEVLVPEWAYSDPMVTALLKTIINHPKEIKQTYASAYVVDGEIHSLGRNMQVKNREGWPVVQGYANHAEMMAYSVASLMNPEISGGVIYVVGLIADDKPFFHSLKTDESGITRERFTCSRCAKKACECGIDTISFPVEDGWRMLSSDEALETAQSFHNESQNNGDGRNDEAMPFSQECSQQFLAEISATSTLDIIKQLEGEFIIYPIVNSLLQLAEDGYISTKVFKQTVFQQQDSNSRIFIP